MLYVVSYDQHRDRDYTPVRTALKQLGAVSVLESVWLLDSDLTAAALRETLQTLTRNEDSLLIIQVFTNSSWAAFKAHAGSLDWLKKHIP
jgi:CRISPR-associated endonuclease Cas2